MFSTRSQSDRIKSQVFTLLEFHERDEDVKGRREGEESIDPRWRGVAEG
jgi:hypothetical protein